METKRETSEASTKQVSKHTNAQHSVQKNGCQEEKCSTINAAQYRVSADSLPKARRSRTGPTRSQQRHLDLGPCTFDLAGRRLVNSPGRRLPTVLGRRSSCFCHSMRADGCCGASNTHLDSESISLRTCSQKFQVICIRGEFGSPGCILRSNLGPEQQRSDKDKEVWLSERPCLDRP